MYYISVYSVILDSINLHLIISYKIFSFHYPDKLVVSTSCSLLHTAVDLVNENMLDGELKSWLAFAAQKLLEVNVLAKTLSGQKDEVLLHYPFFSS